MSFGKDIQSSRIVYVNESQSISRGKPVSKANKAKLNGVLLIKRSGHDTGFAERVRIGVSLRAISKPKPTVEWEQIVRNKSPTTSQRRNFQIDQNYWFGKGITWVIPTPLFETTTIQLNLGSSALLSTGFVIEIFRRDSTIVHEVKASTVFTVGCTVKFDVNWNLSTNTVKATPVLKPAQWPHSFSSPHGSQKSLASGSSSLQLGETVLSSDEE